MIEVKVLRPYKCAKEVSCGNCGIDYPKPHYKILFERKKIAYFDVSKGKKTTTICHGCLFKFINKISRTKKSTYKISFINGRKKSLMEIQPFKDDEAFDL